MGKAEITYARKLIFISIVFVQNMSSLLDNIENELQSFIELLLPKTKIDQSSKAKVDDVKEGK
jgi:2-hydroxy-3-keto-5-methylthiopentenyl-1-phosphate phosphatase